MKIAINRKFVEKWHYLSCLYESNKEIIDIFGFAENIPAIQNLIDCLKNSQFNKNFKNLIIFLEICKVFISILNTYAVNIAFLECYFKGPQLS